MSSLLCCPAESPIEHEARMSASQLKADPVPIWWHRRRILGPSSLLASGGDEVIRSTSTDCSPFPKSWSVNYNSGRGNASCATDESSVFSTVSQEKRQRHEQQRDAFGNCIHHPHIQLAARKRQKTPSRSRFPKIFSKDHNDSTTASSDIQKEEWDIIHVTCPECEKEHIEKCKARYHYKPQAVGKTHQQLNTATTHVPFPATLTLIDSHPHLKQGTFALRVRTEPIPTDQTMHLSCAAATGNRGSLWETPDGAMDRLIPADSNGEIKQVPTNSVDKKCNSNQQTSAATVDQANSSQYQIMERVIPLSSIDHVARGGDAWDVLRQSTGENDFGCRCDIKVHGFSARLLRFDVVNFDSMQNNGTNNRNMLRYSFGGVDFTKPIAAYSNNFSSGTGAGFGASNTHGGGTQYEMYTKENVISKLNSIVLWDLQARKTGMSSWMNSLTNWVDECLSLGVHNVDGEEANVNKTAGQAGRYATDPNYVL